jgi:uncharacterized protein YacL
MFCHSLESCCSAIWALLFCDATERHFLCATRQSPGKISGNPLKMRIAQAILLDTSVIIDGRIADIAKTGFLFGTLLIRASFSMNFSTSRIQPTVCVAKPARHGGAFRTAKESTVPVRITDMDVEGVREVDDKLVILARQLRAPILTNDYNLNRIAGAARCPGIERQRAG